MLPKKSPVDRINAMSKKRKTNEKALPPHIITIEEKNVTHYNCTVCNKTFKSRDHCRYHRYCHSAASKPFACSSCDKKFSKKSHLDYHELCHTGALPFKCSECNKGFRTSHKLKRHSVSHSGVKLVSCHICKKQLSSQDVLKVHLRTHTSRGRSFKCNQCNAAFKDKHTLTRHFETHADEPEWVCEICGRKYLMKRNLVQHKRIHDSSPQRFTCDRCNREFINLSHLKRHQILHSESVEEYVCKICDKVFTRKDNLSRHVKNSHFEDEDPKSETVISWIKESKQKVSNKRPAMSMVVKENICRSSVIKSVASVVEMAKAEALKEDHSQSENSSKVKLTSKPKEPETETCRKVSVISRVGSAPQDVSQKLSEYKVLPPLSQRLKLEGSDVPFNTASCPVAKALKAEKVKNSAAPTHQGNSSKMKETLPNEPGSISKRPSKLEPYRIINQPSLALNLSAKKPTYCVRKYIYDATKNQRKKSRELLVEESVLQSQICEGEAALEVCDQPEDQNVSFIRGEDSLEYVDVDDSDVRVVSRSPNNDRVEYGQSSETRESQQSCRDPRIVVEDHDLKMNHYSTFSNSIEQDEPFVTDYRVSGPEYKTDHSIDSLMLQEPRTEKLYATSHFSNTFETRTTAVVTQQYPSVISSLPNLIPIVNNRMPSANYVSTDRVSSEVKRGCFCIDCLQSDNQVGCNKLRGPSASTSLDLSVRKNFVS